MVHRLTLGAVLGPLLFTLSWLVLGQLSPPYYALLLSVGSHSGAVLPISWLGLGSTGPFMNAAFVLCGVLLLCGIVASFQSIRQMSAFARWSSATFLALSPLGLIVCGIIPLDSMFPYRASVMAQAYIAWGTSLPSPSPANYHLPDTYFISRSLLQPFPSPVHSLGFFLTVVTPVFSFLIAGFFLQRIPRWRRFGRSLLFGSLLTAALGILFFATFSLDRIAVGVSKSSLLGLGGLTNRLLILEVQAWFVALGWLAFRRSKDQQDGSSGLRNDVE